MAKKPVPQVINRRHIELALADLDAGATHDFGAPRKWEVLFNGKTFAPKAVIGLAHEKAVGRRLHPDDFSSGEGATQAVGYLRKLGGISIRRIGPR